MTPDQTMHMRGAVRDFSERALEKYPKGQAEHKGNLWERNNLLEDAQEEVVDQMFYLDSLKVKQARLVKELYQLSIDLLSDNPPSMEQAAGVIHALSIDLSKL